MDRWTEGAGMSTRQWEAATKKLIEQTESGLIKWEGAGRNLPVTEDSTYLKCKVMFYHIRLRLLDDRWVIEFTNKLEELRWRWPDTGLTLVLRRAILNVEAPPEFTGKFLKNFLGRRW
jgi:hypothetical protein